MRRLTATLGLIALAAVFAACAGATATPATGTPGPSTAPTGDGVSIVAKDLAFSPTSITVKAGTAFELTFDNQEDAPHNVAISDASGASVSKGEIISKKAVTYTVPALAAGTYPFICEVHTGMKGTITAQ